MHVVIIGGFLGSGKTTTVLSLGKLLTEQGLRIAIIVNEIGEVGLDGSVLSSSGVETREITNGCICCTLKYNMEFTLESLKEDFDPDVVIIEPTGLAFPGQVKDDLGNMGLGDLTFAPLVNIVDGSRFGAEAGQIPGFVRIQIRDAEVLVINKVDVTPPEIVEEVSGFLREMNPSAMVFRTSALESNRDFRQLIDILAGTGKSGGMSGDRNSIEASGVAAYSLKFHIETTDRVAAESLAADALDRLKASVLALNPGFVGHIKIAIDTGDGLVMGSVTSADAPAGVRVTDGGHSGHPFLAVLCAVTNTDEDKLKALMESDVECALQEHGIPFTKKGGVCEHSHGPEPEELTE
jgi:G3E family GTPase